MKKVIANIGLILVLLILFYIGGLIANHDLIVVLRQHISIMIGLLGNLKK